MSESAGSRQRDELSDTRSDRAESGDIRPRPAGSGDVGEPSLARQALTAPNLLSLLRLAGVPLFLWLLLGPEEDGWAVLVLVLSALTDWLDGKLARWLNQMSRLGQLLDPAADRLYIIATLVAFLVRDIVPWWAVGALLLREVVAGVCVLVLRQYRFAPPEVTYVGKGATFVLMYAFPLLLLMQGDSTAAEIARPLAYAFMIWGGVLYLWSGALYVTQTALAITRHRRGDLGVQTGTVPASDRDRVAGDGAPGDRAADTAPADTASAGDGEPTSRAARADTADGAKGSATD